MNAAIPDQMSEYELQGFHTRAKCKIWMIIRVTDHSNDGILARVYAN